METVKRENLRYLLISAVQLVVFHLTFFIANFCFVNFIEVLFFLFFFSFKNDGFP